MNCCTACGQVIPELDELQKLRRDNANLSEENKALQAELARKVAAISRLRGERNNHRQMSPFADEARRWFDHWNLVCREGRAKEFGADRFDPCVDRLAAGQTFEEWQTACEGARRILAGELRTTLNDPKSFTEMANMLKDEKTLQRFVDDGQRDLKSNVVQLRPAPDHSGIPVLRIWVDGRILAECPNCAQAGSVRPTRDGLGEFQCFGQCDRGWGVYRLEGNDAPAVAALRGRSA